MERGVIRGLVRYTNKNPVRGAVVILERMVTVFNEELQEADVTGVYQNYTFTNKSGEFCFPVNDTKSTYRIKVFDNHHE